MIAIISWLFSFWTSYVFLGSLYYKFDDQALEPRHIFETIGAWMTDTFGGVIGDLFASFGQYLIGGAELIVVIILLSPIIFQAHRAKLHCVGGLLASVVMAGAVFFHLFTPLGWQPTWAVADAAGCSSALFNAANSTCTDTGLANAALSILVLGLVVAFLNKKLHD